MTPEQHEAQNARPRTAYDVYTEKALTHEARFEAEFKAEVAEREARREAEHAANMAYVHAYGHSMMPHDITALNGSRMGLQEWIRERGD